MRKTFLAASMPLALPILLASTPTMSQQAKPGQTGAQTQSGQQAQGARLGQAPADTDATMPMMTVTGRILATKQVKGPNDQKFRVVRLETQSGRVLVADLGPVGSLQDLNLKVGQKVTLTGRPGRVGNRLAFFAREIRTGTQTARIQRPTTNLEGMMRPDTRQVRGQLVKTRQVDVRGGGKNVVALIQTPDGQRLVVDLGSAQALDADLKAGQTIAVRGREVRVGNRIVLLASQARIGDRTVDVTRPAFAPTI